MLLFGVSDAARRRLHPGRSPWILRERLATVEATLSEVDAELQRIESRLNPSDIAPIRAHKFYRGAPRGTLKKTILEIVTAAGPVTTSQIADAIQCVVTPGTQKNPRAGRGIRVEQVQSKNFARPCWEDT